MKLATGHRRSSVLAALLCVFSFASSSHANNVSFHTGETLLDQCRSETDSGSGIACNGYIAGVLDTWIESSGAAAVVARQADASVNFDRAARAFAGFCIYGTVSLRQLSAVAVAYLEANPDKWHQPAAYVVREAFADAFPCRE